MTLVTNLMLEKYAQNVICLRYITFSNLIFWFKYLGFYNWIGFKLQTLSKKVEYALNSKTLTIIVSWSRFMIELCLAFDRHGDNLLYKYSIQKYLNSNIPILPRIV